MGGAASGPEGVETDASGSPNDAPSAEPRGSGILDIQPRTHLSLVGGLGAELADSSFRDTKIVDQKTSDNGNETINDYVLGEILGKGSYATVRTCSRDDGSLFAVKIFDKKRLKRKRVGRFGNAMDSVHRELAVWKKLHHPHVLPLIEAIDSPTSTEMFLVCRHVSGGSVRPDLPRIEPLSEALTLHIFRQVVCALEYLHHQNIIHRDIKPGNLLVEGSLDDFPEHLPHIWLADFGVAMEFEDANDRLSATEGTASFMAPEMCTGEAFSGKPTDVWATGITTFMLIYGVTPFRAEGGSIEGLYDSIQTKPLEFPEDKEMSENFKDLMRKMMDKDPTTRIELSGINVRFQFASSVK
jgi:serine/threonine protein kinase